MIKIRTKANFLFIIIVVMLTIITIIGFMCCEHRSENAKEKDKKIVQTHNTTVEIENDKEVDAELKEIHTETDAKAEFYLSDYERWVAECVVMGESGGESYEGQVLVAQCLLNACLKEGLQPSEIRKKYKYAGWYDNPSNSVKTAVREVFDNGYKVTDEFILYFYAPKICKSDWHETQRFVIEVGGHKFFAEWD